MIVHIGKLNVETKTIDDKPECNDVYGVYVTDHPAAGLGVPKRIGMTGVHGNLCLIRQNGLDEAEIPAVVEEIKKWKEMKLANAKQSGNSCCG